MAKVTWEESFAEGWKEAAAEGRGTDASRNEGAKKNSIEERYFAVYVTYLSRRAESLVRGMERLEQRLKDQEEEVLAQLDILDRTFKAWKEMADRAEQTLGGLQAVEHDASTASV